MEFGKGKKPEKKLIEYAGLGDEEGVRKYLTKDMRKLLGRKNTSMSSMSLQSQSLMSLSGAREEVTHIDVNFVDEEGRFPLGEACANGHLEVARMLVYLSADTKCKDPTGNCALHLACAGGHKSLVDYLLEEDPDCIIIKNKRRETALHLAAQNGHILVVASLLSHGAKLSAVNIDGDTCLDLASRFDHSATVSMLIDHEARILVSTKALFEAVKGNRMTIAKTLCYAGMDVNVRADNEEGSTPLHEAIRYFRKEMVILLLANGADMTIEDKHGKTSLSFAQEHEQNKQGIVDMLDAAASDIDAFTKEHEDFTKEGDKSGIVQTVKDTIAKREIRSYPLLANQKTWMQDREPFRSSARQPATNILQDDISIWESAGASNQYVAFDFGKAHFISGFSVSGFDDGSCPKEIEIQTAEDIRGPWRTIKPFYCEQDDEKQTFKNIELKSRFVRLMFLSNHGGFAVRIRHIEFYGLDTAFRMWLAKLGLESYHDALVDEGFNQLVSAWKILDHDISDLVANPEHRSKLREAARRIQKKECSLAFLQWSIPPVTQIQEGDELPDIVVLANPGCNVRLTIQTVTSFGGPELVGETQLNLIPSGERPSAATFKGLTIAPHGKATIRVICPDAPQFVLNSEKPVNVQPKLKTADQLDQIFDSLAIAAFD
eukprot:Clim_evm107s172 gene=Clim_evmTU107s172